MKIEVEKTLKVLQNGGSILYPTDTVWGLGCDATNADAVSKVYELKRRAEDKSFIVIVDSWEMLTNYLETVPTKVFDLILSSDRPLTVIYQQAKNLATNVVAQDGSIAIRIVKHDFCRELIHAFGKPIVSTSANISGEPVPVNFKEISEEIKQGVGYVVGWEQDLINTPKPSKIIKITSNQQVEVIRE